jgi:acetyl-CoA carboxylase carboxyl transferase subunit beta
MKSLNPIDFEGYTEKTFQLRRKTGLRDAVVTGNCTIMGSRARWRNGYPVYDGLNGVGGRREDCALFERAGDENLPVVLFTASGGAACRRGLSP